ncbi:MAG: hypothetical protein AAGH92_13270 [Planctomycetota bacterium]
MNYTIEQAFKDIKAIGHSKTALAREAGLSAAIMYDYAHGRHSPTPGTLRIIELAV